MLSWLDRFRGAWWIEGWDTFGGHSYPIPGRYRNEDAAVRAARRQLKRLERLQPSASSGGQDGIQDQVFVVAPDGERYRVRE